LKLREETLYRVLRRTSYGRGCGPVVNRLQKDWITVYLDPSVRGYAYRYVIVIYVTNYTTAYSSVESARKETEDYYYYYCYHHYHRLHHHHHHHPVCHLYVGYLQLYT